jgi:diguanylate cyclase (GGDEF)-like protein
MDERAAMEKTIAQVDLQCINLDEAKYLLGLFAAVIDNFPGGIILTDSSLKVLLCNNELQRLMEFPASLFENHAPSLPELFHFNAARGEYGPGNPKSLVAAKMSLVEKRIPHCFERMRPDGRVLEIRGVPISNGGFVTSYTDVTERSRLQKKVFHQATSDSLTGLLNRTSLEDKFIVFSANAKRKEGFALFYLDIDDFKPINDKYGHLVGDAVIVEVANRITATIRETDIAARIGGDEFVILQSTVSTMEDIATLARRLTAALRKPFEHNGNSLFLGASIGISTSITTMGEIEFEMMVGQADSEMYKVKREKKGSFKIYGCNEKSGFCTSDSCGCLSETLAAPKNIQYAAVLDTAKNKDNRFQMSR